MPVWRLLGGGGGSLPLALRIWRFEVLIHFTFPRTPWVSHLVQVANDWMLGHARTVWNCVVAQKQWPVQPARFHVHPRVKKYGLTWMLASPKQQSHLGHGLEEVSDITDLKRPRRLSCIKNDNSIAFHFDFAMSKVIDLLFWYNLSVYCIWTVSKWKQL